MRRSEGGSGSFRSKEVMRECENSRMQECEEVRWSFESKEAMRERENARMRERENAKRVDRVSEARSQRDNATKRRGWMEFQKQGDNAIMRQSVKGGWNFRSKEPTR